MICERELFSAVVGSSHVFISLLLFSVLSGYLLYYYFQRIPLESLCSGACGYDDFVLLVGGFAEFFERIKPLVLSIYRGL